MAKPQTKPKPPDSTRKYEKKTIDDRIAQTQSKLVDLQLKKKVKDDPEMKKLVAQIRNLRKIPNPTTEMKATIDQLVKRVNA